MAMRVAMREPAKFSKGPNFVCNRAARPIRSLPLRIAACHSAGTLVWGFCLLHLPFCEGSTMRRTLPIRSRQLANNPVKAQASRRRHDCRGDKRLGTKRRRRFGLEALERREMLTGDLSGAEAALAATMANLAGQEQDAIETRDQAVADAQEDYADAYATAYGTFVSNENDAWD